MENDEKEEGEGAVNKPFVLVKEQNSIEWLSEIISIYSVTFVWQ